MLKQSIRNYSYISFLLIFLPVIALCEPVYLDCHIPKSDAFKEHSFSVKLDETTNKITHTRENGEAFNTEGFFTANIIRYQEIADVGAVLTTVYEIDRSDITIKKTLTVDMTANMPDEFKKPPDVSVGDGTCEIAIVKDRKI